MVKILALGAAVQDVFLSHSEEFMPREDNATHENFLRLTLGGKADVDDIFFSTGGGATNAAVTFARQGLEAEFIGMVGKDPAGQAVLSNLDEEGVNTERVKYSDSLNTGYSVLLLAPSGERTILTYRGASTHYDAKDFDISETHADWLYVSSLAGNVDFADQIFHQAKAAGMKVFFNPGKDELAQPEKLKALLEDVDVLAVNKQEMQSIVSGETLEELARHGHNYVETVIVSDGPNGVLASDAKSVIRAGMYEDVPVIDRTGAGDAFGSGFLSQWAQGKSLKDSIIFASANSTSVVGQKGAKTGILQAGVELHDMPVEEKPY